MRKINFCRENKITSVGGKIEITKRIKIYLETGEIPRQVKKEKSKSDFDWKNTELTIHTVINDNYSNTQNVRKFFASQIGKSFKFNTMFMNWMKENVGKILNDAIFEWKRIQIILKDKNHKTEIAPQFEYNQYIRDFLTNNPVLTKKDAVKYWKIKRSKSGSNKYTSNDLN